jgi:GH24 family phage-related lysozyme (muramidase)
VGGNTDDIVRAAGGKEKAIKAIQAMARDGDDATKAEARGLIQTIRSNLKNPTPSGVKDIPADVLEQMRKRSGGYVQGRPEASIAAGSLAGVGGVAAVGREQPQEDLGAFMDAQSDQAMLGDMMNINGLVPVSSDIVFDPVPVQESVSQTFVVSEEGFLPKAYKDSLGITTIGYGFNLEQSNARDIIKRVKIPEKYELLLNGKQQLSQESARKLLDYKLNKSQKAAQKIVSGFDSLGENQKAALTSMAYHMGGEGLRKFQKTISYLEKGNSKAVENQILSSRMARQTPARAQRTALMLAYDLSPQEAEQSLLQQGRIKPTELKYAMVDM